MTAWTFSISPAIGIELGSSFSCMAVLPDPEQKPQVIQQQFGRRIMPSYVAYSFSGGAKPKVFVGWTAKKAACHNPENTISGIKRLVGQSFNDPGFQRWVGKKQWPFNLVNTDDGSVGIKVEEQTLLPHVVLRELILKLKQTAEDALDCPVNEAVITIPSSYTETHKNLTRNACQSAGFTSVHLMSKAVAAAVGLAPSLKTGGSTRTYLIFNFGGGALDVTVFDLKPNNQVDIIATGGDHHLGGEDFDDLLLDYCLGEFRKRHGINLARGKTSESARVRRRTAKVLRRLRNECEAQKCLLSFEASVVVKLKNARGNIDLEVPVTRSKFEGLITPLLNRSIKVMSDTLLRSGCLIRDIHDVILVGSSTRIPKVQRMVEDYFDGRRVNGTCDVNKAAVIGAAIEAYNIFKPSHAPPSMVTLNELEQTVDELPVGIGSLPCKEWSSPNLAQNPPGSVRSSVSSSSEGGRWCCNVC